MDAGQGRTLVDWGQRGQCQAGPRAGGARCGSTRVERQEEAWHLQTGCRVTPLRGRGCGREEPESPSPDPTL